MAETFDPWRCPRCGSGDTIDRNGVGPFEGERYCWACYRRYSPFAERDKWLAEERERLELVTSRE